MESPFLEICKQHLAKALGKLPQLWSQPWCEQEVGLETSRDPPYFCSDFMSQARKKCHSSQNLVHLGTSTASEDCTHISVPQPPPSWQWHFIAGRAWWELVRFEVPLPKAYSNKLFCLIFLVQTLWDQLSLPEIPRNFMRRNLDAVK